MTRHLQADEDAARLLEQGGVLVLPTDTLPGLHARIDCPGAVSRVLELKGRPDGKPLLLLAASLPVALTATVGVTERQRAYAEACWPGPYSLVLPAAPDLPREVTGGGDTVAVRVPKPARLRALLTLVGRPVVSTSANLADKTPAGNLAAAVLAFGDRVDGVYDPGDPEPAGPAVASALIDLTAWPPRVLRKGPQPPPEVSDRLDPPGGEN